MRKKKPHTSRNNGTNRKLLTMQKKQNKNCVYVYILAARQFSISRPPPTTLFSRRHTTISIFVLFVLLYQIAKWGFFLWWDWIGIRCVCTFVPLSNWSFQWKEWRENKSPKTWTSCRFTSWEGPKNSNTNCLSDVAVVGHFLFHPLAYKLSFAVSWSQPSKGLLQNGKTKTKF